MNGARPIPRPAPWWLEGGEETCEVCLATYAYEVEVRCHDCDQPMCPGCAVWVRAQVEVYCPGCAPQEDGGPRGQGGGSGDQGGGSGREG
jgi:hypothetical protein